MTTDDKEDTGSRQETLSALGKRLQELRSVTSPDQTITHEVGTPFPVASPPLPPPSLPIPQDEEFRALRRRYVCLNKAMNYEEYSRAIYTAYRTWIREEERWRREGYIPGSYYAHRLRSFENIFPGEMWTKLGLANTWDEVVEVLREMDHMLLLQIRDCAETEVNEALEASGRLQTQEQMQFLAGAEAAVGTAREAMETVTRVEASATKALQEAAAAVKRVKEARRK